MECKAHQNHCDAQNSSSYVLSCLDEDLICYHHYDIDGGRKMMICESYTPIVATTTTTSATSTTSTTHTPTSTLVTTQEPTTVVSTSDVRASTTTMLPNTTTPNPSLRALTNTSSAKQIQKKYVLKQSNRTNLAASPPPAKPEYIYVDNNSDVAIWACIIVLMLLQLYQILRNKTCTRRPRKISNPPPVNNQQFQRNSWSDMPPVQHMRREQKRRERKTKLREIVNGNGVPKPPPPTSESLVKKQHDAPPLPSRPPPKHPPPSAEDGLKTLNALRGTAKLKQQMRRLHESQKT